MKTVKDLGRAKKMQCPGEFDDISDEELGRALKIRYPGEYDDFIEDLGVEQVSLSTPAFNENIQSLVEFYSPEQGRLSAWWRSGKSESRTRFLKSLNDEQKHLIEQAVMLENAVIAQRARQVSFNTFIARNQALFIQLKAEVELTVQATKNGMNAIDFSYANREIAIIQAQKDKEFAIEELRLKYKLENDRESSRIKLDEHRIKTETELNSEIRLAEEEVRLAIIADYLTDNQKVTLIQDLLDGLYKQIDEIETNPNFSNKRKQRMIEDREASIEKFRKQRDEAENKLLSPNNR